MTVSFGLAAFVIVIVSSLWTFEFVWDFVFGFLSSEDAAMREAVGFPYKTRAWEILLASSADSCSFVGSVMPIAEFISRTLTRRRGLVWLAVAVVALGSLLILVSRISLDSEVLNMLPGNFSSVQGLKIYDRDFEQTRELTFALRCQPNDVDKLEEFAPVFAEHLRRATMVRARSGRFADGNAGRDSRSACNRGSATVESRARLNSTRRCRSCSRTKCGSVLHRLHQQIEAGSPRPQFELEFDPLGLIGPALKPFAESNPIEEDQPLASADRTMRVFLVVTNQRSIGAFECQRLMREVNAFRDARPRRMGGRPAQVLVTGRSAYVAEISLSMRHDIVVTFSVRCLLVGVIFFTGFRRWMPLLGMGFSLLLSCLVALALGLLIFGRLNMVTVGFCAILVGLGVDFAILCFGRYQQARTDGESHPQAIATPIQKLGRAVFFGALTTAVGFLALILSGSIGFSQLGVLIAIGILFAGFFMCTVLLFVCSRTPAAIASRLDFQSREKICGLERAAAGHDLDCLVDCGLSILTLIGFSPRPALPFDSSARSLEPKNSRAGLALAAIMSKMPTRWEPVLAIVRAPDAQTLHDDWRKICRPTGASCDAAGENQKLFHSGAL